MRPSITRLARVGLALVAISLLAGCGSRTQILIDTTGTAEPTPTIAAIFGELPTVPSVLESPGRPTATPISASRRPTPAPVDESLPEIVVYDDELSSSWTLEQSTKLDYSTQSRDSVDKGRYAIRAIAKENFAKLYFTVQQEARTAFRREDIFGLRFRLGGGRGSIAKDALVVTVVGSDRQPYWIPNDTSVKFEGRVTDDLPLFSETRLYFLGVNRTISPGEWVDVVVWLDDLIYDPEYTYLTGFYLKTDNLDRFYVDNVALILAP
ncbi:MAG: hypothetical protein HGA45_00910 [Chloroflexales bacterium]|nr:hypothetical protein [Chloroflexales bacterium]